MLRRTQNADGGWPYFPGKASWLEPTVYAAFALHGEPAADRAWLLLASWQQADGSWRPTGSVPVRLVSGTALCLSLLCSRRSFGPAFRKAINWIVKTEGIENAPRQRIATTLTRVFGWASGSRDSFAGWPFAGWPWIPGEISSVEATAQALLALKKAEALNNSDPRVRERVRIAEAQLLNARGKDGGWNSGSPALRGAESKSQAETTALALLGLQGRPELETSLEWAAGWLHSSPASPLARAWLRIALQVNGVELGEAPDSPVSNDVMITALEALGASGGNHALLQARAS